jgi:DNA polymerase/3'-5' exonuclease PolX
MSTSETKIPLATAQNVAKRFLSYLESYCSQMSVAGSVRREVEYVGDIDVVVIPKDEFSMGVAFCEGFKGMVMNGTRLKRFKYPESGIQIELHITNISDWGRILAIATGSSSFSHHLAVAWSRRGWAGTEEGLRRKSECNHKSTWKIKPEYKSCPTLPPIFSTEEQFFAFIGVDYVYPKARSWVSSNQEYNYKL